MAVALIGIDGDDTLWHSEVHFVTVQTKIRELLGPWVDGQNFDERLLTVERQNLGFYGYGVKGFALSLIETAIELTNASISAQAIGQILDLAKELLAHPLDLLDHVADVIPRLALDYRLVLITKGDLFHQETKVAASGLAHHFVGVEIVADKAPQDYERLLVRYGVEPAGFVMIGNSLRSDVVPVVELGGRAIHIPYEHTWAHEHVDLPPELAAGVTALASMAQVPIVLAQLNR